MEPTSRVGVPSKIDVGPIKLDSTDMRISNYEIVFVVNIKTNLRVVEVVDTQVGKLEIKRLLPNWIICLLPHLHNGFSTAVLRVWSRI